MIVDDLLGAGVTSLHQFLHLLIDTDAPKDASLPLPTTDQVKHFGKGQTEASVELTPGKHTLQLLLGDQNHTPHNPPVMSKKITITVK